MARKSDKSMPSVIEGILYSDDLDNGLKVGSALWQAWLMHTRAFYVEFGHTSYSMRKEVVRNTVFWYAYKRTNGKLSKRYAGKSENITLDRLKELFQRGI